MPTLQLPATRASEGSLTELCPQDVYSLVEKLHDESVSDRQWCNSQPGNSSWTPSITPYFRGKSENLFNALFCFSCLKWEKSEQYPGVEAITAGRPLGFRNGLSVFAIWTDFIFEILALSFYWLSVLTTELCGEQTLPKMHHQQTEMIHHQNLVGGRMLTDLIPWIQEHISYFTLFCSFCAHEVKRSA